MGKRNKGRWTMPEILLEEMRAAGATVFVSCPICRHKADLDPHQIQQPGDVSLKALGHRLRCTSCGRHGGCSAAPELVPWVAYLRLTGQQERVPWNAAFIVE